MDASRKAAQAKSNRKTALVLALIAAFFFAAVIFKRLWM